MTTYAKLMAAGLLAAAVSGCWWDSSNRAAAPVPEPDPDPDPTPTPTVYSLEMLLGQVTGTDLEPLAGVTVDVTFSNETEANLSGFSTISDDSGNFRLPLSAGLTDGATLATVRFSKDGFIDGERTVTLTGANAVIHVNGILAQVQQISVKRSDLEDIAFGANGQSIFRISLVKGRDGKQKVITGEARAAAGEENQLSIDIPTAGIDPGVEVVNGELAYFDSSDPDDIQSFPGDFVGFGETANQGQGISFNREDQDADEYRLISSSFSQIKLTDETGEPLPMSDALGAAGANPVVTMKISQGSYSTIEKDFDLNEAGIQLPIFIYRSGEGWQYVGNGLLVDGSFNAPDVTVGTAGELDLTSYSGTLYVQIEIIAANQWLQWINLDWPLEITTSVTQVCFNGRVLFDGGDPYNGLTGVRLGDGGFEWIYIEDGEFALDRVFTIATATLENPANWLFSIHNARTGLKESIPLPEVIATGSDCNEIELTMVNPFQCEVQGTVFESDGTTPLANSFVTTSVNGVQSSLQTGEDGSYLQAVDCDATAVVSAIGQQKQALVTEQNSPVALNFAKANQPPVLGVERATRETLAEGGDTETDIRWFVSDPEGDAVSVTVESCVSGSNSCDITPNAGTNSATLSFAEPGIYEVTAVARDATHDVPASLKVQVMKQGNREPVIRGFEIDGHFVDAGSLVDLIVSQQVDITVLARDLDADNLSYTWSGITCSARTCPAESFTSAGTQTLSVTVKDDHPDGALETSAELTINVANDESPEARMVVSDNLISEQDGVNSIPVRATLLVQDDLTPRSELEIIWKLMLGENDVSGQLLPDYSANPLDITLATGILATGSYSLSATITDTDVNGAPGNSVTVSKDLLVVDDLPPSLQLSASDNDLFGSQAGTENPIVITAEIADDKTDAAQLNLTWLLPEGISGTADGLTNTISASSLLPGEYLIRAEVTDSANQVTQDSLLIVIKQDMPPQITLAASANNLYATQAGTTQDVVIAATLSDDNSSASELGLSWTLPPGLSGTENGNSLTLAAADLVPGSYLISATVEDAAGQTSQASITLTILEDMAPEIVSMTVTPGSQTETINEVNGNPIAVFLSAQDDQSASLNVEWSVNPQLTFTSTDTRLDIAAGAAPTGTYQVTATVRDDRGQQTSKTVTFEVTVREGNVDIEIE